VQYECETEGHPIKFQQLLAQVSCINHKEKKSQSASLLVTVSEIRKRITGQYNGTAWFQGTLTPANEVNWNDSVKEHVSLPDADW